MLAHVTQFDFPIVLSAFAAGAACGVTAVLGFLAYGRRS